MKLVRARGRLAKDERGFTLPEMMVTIVIMIVVMFALYSIFDMSIRVFSFGNNEVEASENARLGLERMEREIRAAYPVDRTDPAKRYLFFSADGSTADPPEATALSTTQITFGNDLNGDGKVACPSGACEYITYKLDGSTLRRINAASSTGAGEPVVEFVEPNGLDFTYLDSDGAAYGGTDESKIHGVRMTLDVRVEGGEQDGTQTLATDVELRNRGGMALSAVNPPPAAICADGIDNDGDGKTDYPGDPGCVSTTDSDETDEVTAPPTTACADGADNDGDGKIDYPTDPGCSSSGDTDETDQTNRPPKATNDSATVPKNGSVKINVLANDSDPDGDPLSVQSFTQPSTGTVTRNSDGTVTYAAKSGNSGLGTFTFTYVVSDGKGGAATGTVSVTVS